MRIDPDIIENTIFDFVNDLMIKAVQAEGRVPEEPSFTAEHDVTKAVANLSEVIVAALNEGRTI